MNKKKQYIVNEDDLKKFIECRARLEALESGGVDNWCWYSESYSDYLEEYFCDVPIDDDDMSFETLVNQEIIKFKEVD